MDKTEFTDQQRKLIVETMEKLTFGGKGATSIVVYAKIGNLLNMEQKEFQPKLSRACNSGEITGYIGRKRAGYFRNSDIKPKPKTEEKSSNDSLDEIPEAPPPSDIVISSGVRLRYGEGNWSIEKKIIVGEMNGPIKAKEENVGQERWVPVPAHYGTLDSALKGLLTRHINLLGVQQTTVFVENETKTSVSEVKELLRTIQEAVATVKKAVENRQG